MRLVDNILRRNRERERRVEAARDAVKALTREEQETLVAELLQLLARAEGLGELSASIVPVSPKGAKPRTQSVEKLTRTELVERIVLEHPEGISVADVAARTGQTYTNADASLRYARASRGAIGKTAAGLWIAQDKADEYEPRTSTPSVYCASIRRVLEGVTVPMSTAEIFFAARKHAPDLNRASLGSFVTRMLKRGDLVVCHRVGRRLFYLLADTKQTSEDAIDEGGAPPTTH